MKVKILLLFLVIANLIAKRSEGQIPVCNVQDSLALVDLYNSTNGPGWKNSSGWLNGPVWGWSGISESNAGRVIAIYLDFNNLSGTIPESIGNLSSLTFLSLGVNNLSGGIPPSMGNLTNVTYLNLIECPLGGSIPDSFGNLVSMNNLELGYDQLVGNIPSSLGNLSNLAELALDYNNLTGPIPETLGNLSNLTYLTMIGNKLSGSIPSSLGNLSNLKVLQLGVNQLSGNIPSSLGNLSNLIGLNLEFNELSGAFPSWINNLTNLRDVLLGNNQLIGPIPPLKKLDTLWLYQNKFTYAGMEDLVTEYNSGSFLYAPQATIKINQNGAILNVSVGGTPADNTYRWYKNGLLDSTKVGDSTYKVNAGGKYCVTVNNSIATNLTLYSDTVSGLKINLINPLPSMVDPISGNLLTDVSKIDMTAIVNGTSTDGVSDILLVVNSSVPITFSLGSDYDGYLSTLAAPNTNSSTEVTVQPINGKAVAVYTPPDGYGTSTPANESISVNAQDANNDTTSVRINLVTPPVLLIHGMWSKPQQWIDDNFYSYLFTNGFQKNLYLVDYHQYNTTTFDPSNPENIPIRAAIDQQIQQAIKNAASNGIIVTQVDVVAHSLGGLQARCYSQDNSLFLKPLANYNKGYFHKLITLGTPHRGSPLGPALWNAQDNVPINFGYVGNKKTVSQIMAEQGHPIGDCLRDFYIQSPAIQHLSQSSLFKTYAICGDYQADPSNSATISQTAGYIDINALTFVLTGTNLNALFASRCDVNNVLPNDIIVPQFSQTGNIANYSIYFGTGHSFPAGNTETNNPLIQQKVRQLLLSDNIQDFSIGFPAFSTSELNCNTTNVVKSNGIQTPKNLAINLNAKYSHNTANNVTANYQLKITSPTSTDLLKNNGKDSLTLTLRFTDSSKLVGSVCLLPTGDIIAMPSSSPFTSKILLPASTNSGKFLITALGRDVYGNLYADTSGVNIQPSDTLKSITASPAQVQLDSMNRVQNLTVTGLFTNGQDTTYRDITLGTAGTQYTTQSNNNIASVTSSGQVNGIAAGTDTIVITNQNITANVPVNVNPDLLAAAKQTNSISLNVNDQILGSPPLVLSGTVTSGEPITYNLISGPVNLANGIVAVSDTGLVKIVASSPADAYFNAAPNDTVSFKVLQFPLPVTNLKLAITSTTCRGSADGSINITASDALDYTATISGNGLNTSYPFTDSLTIANLSAGTYSVCITIAGQSDFQQCYTVVVTEPADLSVYTSINNSGNTLNLTLNGGKQYDIQLNGTSYTTTENTIDLPLKVGNNDLVVTTDKLCQGTFEKLINSSGSIIPYPVPFQNTLNLNLGNSNVNNVSVEIHSAQDGKLVYLSKYVNQSGVLQLDLSGLNNGVYALHLVLDNTEKIFKILKQ